MNFETHGRKLFISWAGFLFTLGLGSFFLFITNSTFTILAEVLISVVLISFFMVGLFGFRQDISMNKTVLNILFVAHAISGFVILISPVIFSVIFASIIGTTLCRTLLTQESSLFMNVLALSIAIIFFFCPLFAYVYITKYFLPTEVVSKSKSLEGEKLIVIERSDFGGLGGSTEVFLFKKRTPFVLQKKTLWEGGWGETPHVRWLTKNEVLIEGDTYYIGL